MKLYMKHEMTQMGGLREVVEIVVSTRQPIHLLTPQPLTIYCFLVRPSCDALGVIELGSDGGPSSG